MSSGSTVDLSRSTKSPVMNSYILLVALSLAAGQQFQDSRDFNTAVRLARSGFFQQGGSINTGSFQNNNNRFQGISFQSSSNNFQNQNGNTQSSPFSSSSSNLNNNNNNQFQSNSFNSRNLNQFQNRPIQQTQQTSFSSSNRQQEANNQFQSNTFTSSSPKFNSGSTFQNNQQRFGSQFQTSGNQGSTGSRLSSVNIQLTPSTRFQNQQTTGTSFQTGNNRFQQANFNQQNIGSSAQSNFNNQFSSGNRQQSNSLRQSTSSSSPSSSSFNNFNEGVSGVFEPLNLPSGASRLLGSIGTSFSCVDRPYGYYADQENSCRVFHVCNPSLFSNGEIETYQYSFMCGEGTVFDQNEMVCKMEFDALPCEESSSYYFRNEEFGRPEEKSF